MDVFHLAHSSHSFPGSLHRSMYFPPKYKMAAQLLLLKEMLDFALKEESLVNSDDDDLIPILAAIATYTRRDLHRNQRFYENILPAYTTDEFKSHFRMTRGTFEPLCREVQATGRFPRQNAFGRPPIPLDKQVLAFVWFIVNSKVIRRSV